MATPHARCATSCAESSLQDAMSIGRRRPRARTQARDHSSAGRSGDCNLYREASKLHRSQSYGRTCDAMNTLIRT